MATAQDADLILKLYELRTESMMRKARQFVIFEFSPTRFEEITALQREVSEKSAFLRQVVSYWEMAAAFVLRGALDADLYLDANPEPFFIYAKYTPFLEDNLKASGQPFMPKTAKLIETYPAMQDRYTGMLAMLEARHKQSAG